MTNRNFRQIINLLDLRWQRRVPVIHQTETAERGLACLAMICGHFGKNIDLIYLRRKFNLSARGATLAGINGIAEQLGMATRALSLELDELRVLKTPCILHWDFSHFVVLVSVKRNRYVLHDPARGIRYISREEMSRYFTGVALEVWPGSEFQSETLQTRISLRSLINSIYGIKRTLAKIFCLSVVIEAILLRLGLAYGPGGMSLREVTAWAQLHDVATLSDVALLKRLRNAADWFGILAAQTLAVRAAVTGCTSGKRLRLVDGTAISAPGGGSAEWRLHMGYDPHTCQFTDFELTDSRDAERLDRFAQTADEIRIADRGFGSRPECIRSLAFGEADYIVRVHWRGLRWLTAEGMRFDMMGFLRGLDCGKNGETTVMIGNSGNKKAGAPFPARLIAVSLPPEKALISKTRLLSENRRKGRVVQAETLEAAGHVLLLTSLPEDEYSAEQVADCYRLRWQIELAFKRLKSLLHLDALRAKEPELAKAWIFANLLAAFLIDDIIQPSLDFPPRSAGSEKKN